MNLWRSIQKIDWPHLMGFGWIMIKRPLLIYPIYKATQHTLSTASKLYGKAHFKSGPANAFRHAYWNVALCTTIHKRVQNPKTATAYCAEIVNYYEKSTKNLPMDHSMDYHNNQIGRNVFLSNLGENRLKVIEILQNMAKNAKKVVESGDFSKFQDSLVYLREDEIEGVLPKTTKA